MRYLGIDFGLKRIGLAISEQGEIATPLKIVEVSSLKDAVLKLEQIIKQEKSEKVIVGLPEGKIGKITLGFIRKLREIGFDVDSACENLSSKLALSKMIELNIPKNKRRFNDACSATIILQNYLDNI